MVTAEPRVAVQGISLYFPGFALQDVSFTVEEGEYLVLLGPTGSGKTILLETLCGLHTPRSGSVWIAGRDVTRLDPAKRAIAYVPQDYALIPFKTVRENIAFGLEAHRLPAAEITARTNDMLAMLGISHLERRYPARLSGGERQRVALGRALAIRPSVLLLDEPFSAIDESLREDVFDEVRRLHQTLRMTTIHISHSLEEATSVADRLAILNAGRIVQVGAPEEIMRTPRDLFVARFLRLQNLVPGEVCGGVEGKTFFAGGMALCPTTAPPGPAVAVLPTGQLRVSHACPLQAPDCVVVPARVASSPARAYRPALKLNGLFNLSIPGIFPREEWAIGDEVFVSVPRAAIHVLPNAGSSQDSVTCRARSST